LWQPIPIIVSFNNFSIMIAVQYQIQEDKGLRAFQEGGVQIVGEGSVADPDDF
jgi:hypothetical protein